MFSRILGNCKLPSYYLEQLLSKAFPDKIPLLFNFGNAFCATKKGVIWNLSFKDYSLKNINSFDLAFGQRTTLVVLLTTPSTRCKISWNCFDSITDHSAVFSQLCFFFTVHRKRTLYFQKNLYTVQDIPIDNHENVRSK